MANLCSVCDTREALTTAWNDKKLWLCIPCALRMLAHEVIKGDLDAIAYASKYHPALAYDRSLLWYWLLGESSEHIPA